MASFRLLSPPRMNRPDRLVQLSFFLIEGFDVDVGGQAFLGVGNGAV